MNLRTLKLYLNDNGLRDESPVALVKAAVGHPVVDSCLLDLASNLTKDPGVEAVIEAVQSLKREMGLSIFLSCSLASSLTCSEDDYGRNDSKVHSDVAGAPVDITSMRFIN